MQLLSSLFCSGNEFSGGIIEFIFQNMTQPLKSIFKFIKFFCLEDYLLNVKLADVGIGINALEVNLLEKPHMIIGIFHLVSKGKVWGVDNVAPEPPDHDGIARASLLPALYKRSQCPVRNGSIGEPGLESDAGESELTVFELVYLFREVLDTEIVVPVY